MIGQTISHYKILEKLGEGGMGVVYKAHDTKLDRDVALKFLPHHLTVDKDDKARFLQEAKAASAVMHPNVCVIYDIAEHDGNQFIVMEYVDGQTIRKQLETRNLSLETAIFYAIQIGDALQEAHSKGIVHRDIKAENIMVNTKNQIKVMDFGLAKLKGSLKLTKTSSTVGTLGYMAPEQIQGGEVDARSDIFSFGVVLYEMLTGHLPFRGEHEAAMMYSILNEAPVPLITYKPDVAPDFLHILSKALEKDPQDRYQSVNEMVVDLRRSLRHTTRVVKHVAEREGVRGSSFSGRKLSLRLSAVVLVIVLAVALLWRKGAPQFNPNLTILAIPMPFTEFGYPGLSQDGNYIVFSAADAKGKWDLYWMHKLGGDARRVTSDSSTKPQEMSLIADISPDGSQIVYTRPGPISPFSEICVVSSNGGIGRRIVELGGSPRWRPDGARIGFIWVSEMMTTSLKFAVFSVNPDGTDRRVEFIDSLGFPDARSNASFSWSPDGQSIAWIRTFPNRTAELIVRNLKSCEEKQLTHDEKNIDEVCWTRQGMIIFSSSKLGSTNLWYVPADGGEEMQITKGSGPDLGMRVSADGRKLLYYQNQAIGNIWSASGDGTNPQQLTFDDQNITSLCLSPDRKHIVFSMAGGDQGFRSNEAHLYVMERDGSKRRQLTFGDERAMDPRFSPDGKYLAYRSFRVAELDDSSKINILEFPGSGTPRILSPGRSAHWINDTALSIGRGLASWRTPLQGGMGSKMLQDSTFVCPIEKGKFTLILDIRHNRLGIWLKEEDPTEPRLLTSEAWTYLMGNPVLILPLEPALYLVRSDRSIWRMNLPDGRQQKLRGALPGVTSTRYLNFSPDGKEIVFINRQSRSKLVIIENLFL